MTGSLYNELAPFYDRVYHWKDYAEEARAVSRIAKRHLGRPARTLLDVACGTGRHLEHFRRVLEVAGVDESEAMLRLARRRLGCRVPLLKGDMRTFLWNQRFDVVVCLFGAIGYMNARGDRDRAIANFYRHVAPGGMAIVEGWFRPDRWLGRHLYLEVYDGPDMKIARLSRSSRRGRISIIDMHYLIAQPGRPVRHVVETHRNSLVAPGEMLDSFRRAGFRARALLSGPYRERGLYIGTRPD